MPTDDTDFVDVDDSNEPIEAEDTGVEEAHEAGESGDIEQEPADEMAPDAEAGQQTYSKEEMEASVSAAVNEARQQNQVMLQGERNKWEQSQRQQRQRIIQSQKRAQEARRNQAIQQQTALPSLQDWLAEGGNVESWNVFNNHRQSTMNVTNQLTERLNAMENAARVQRSSADIESHLERGMSEALKKFPVLESPAWKRQLGEAIYAQAVRISSSNGDIRRMNVMNIAKGLNEAIGGEVSTSRKRATKKLASAPGGSPNGSPTKPVKGKPKPMNTEEWLDNGFDELERELKPRI